MDLTIYEIIEVAYRSRLLFRTEPEYRDVLGVTFETISDNRENLPLLDRYVERHEPRCRKLMDESFREVMDNYLVASEFYLHHDWGSRKDARTRRLFFQKIFRMVATGGMRISNDEELRFKILKDDTRLIHELFPNGWRESSSVDIVFLILFAFDVIKPWNRDTQKQSRRKIPGLLRSDTKKSRSVTDADTIRTLSRLRDLLTLLKECMPCIGSLQKPAAFDEWTGIIDSLLRNPDPLRRAQCSDLWMAYALNNVGKGCLSTITPENLRLSAEQFMKLSMPGIWIDDADNGARRFWIFPENIQAAFCYSFADKDNIWTLEPYAFSIYDSDDPFYVNSCYFVSPEGNMRQFENPSNRMDNSDFAHMKISVKTDDKTDEITVVNFDEGPVPVPSRFNWRAFRKLLPDHPRYEDFRKVIHNIYNVNTTDSSVKFQNPAAPITDMVNNFVGLDRYYLYVLDFRPADRYIISEQKDQKDSFIYEAYYHDPFPATSFLDMEISEEHPLYAIPHKIDKWKCGTPELRKFAELMEDSDNIRFIYIIRFP